MPYRQKFLLGEVFADFPPTLVREVFIPPIFLSRDYDYIEDMANLTTLAKNYSTKYNAEVAGAWWDFV